MKSTGIIRKVDELGRIVLPIELRRLMNIEPADGVEIYVEGNQIILQKHEPHCIFCGGNHDVIDFKDRSVCKACIEEMSK